MPSHAEIAGAGLTGLALAAALARSGWSVRVHEASSALRATGGGLYITEDGLAAASAVGAQDILMRALTRPDGYETRVDGERHSYDGNDGTFFTTLRQHLYATFLQAAEAAGVEIVTGSRAVAAKSAGVLILENGQELAADLVVAADGVGSRIAETIGIGAQRRRFDDSLIRVLLDRTMMIDPAWQGAVDLWRYGDRPLRVLYSPCSPTQCYLVMMAPATDREAAALPIDAPLWSRQFPELAPLLAQSLDEARIDRYGSIRLDRWVHGRVAIIGDAAHAMPSSIGKGANLGMRNAVALAEALANHPDPDAALGAWQAERRPIVDTAQEIAERVALQRTLTKGPSGAAYEVPLLGTA